MTARQHDIGEQFVRALAGKNAVELRAALAADVRFRGLTPGRVWEANGQDDAIDVLLGSWFEATDHIDETVSHDVHHVVDKVAIRYCFRVRNGDGVFLVEQQGYASLDQQGRMADVAIVCSGFQPIDGTVEP